MDIRKNIIINKFKEDQVEAMSSYMSLLRKEGLDNILRLTKSSNQSLSIGETRQIYSKYLDLNDNHNKWVCYKEKEVFDLLKEFDLGAKNLCFRLPSYVHIKNEQDYHLLMLNEALSFIHSCNSKVFELAFVYLQRICLYRLESSAGGLHIEQPGIMWVNPNGGWKLGDYLDYLIFALNMQLLIVESRLKSHRVCKVNGNVHTYSVPIKVTENMDICDTEFVYTFLSLVSVYKWRDINSSENSYECFLPNNKLKIL